MNHGVHQGLPHNGLRCEEHILALQTCVPLLVSQRTQPSHGPFHLLVQATFGFADQEDIAPLVRSPIGSTGNPEIAGLRVSLGVATKGKHTVQRSPWRPVYHSNHASAGEVVFQSRWEIILDRDALKSQEISKRLWINVPHASSLQHPFFRQDISKHVIQFLQL